MRLFKGLGLFIWAASAFLLVHELHPVSCGGLGNRFVENGDLVTDLPGQPVVQFRHYAGYVTVNKKNGRALFYWFFEAASHADEKPLVLWLNGGPRCSSVGYGAAQEIGPFLVEKDGSKLKFNPFSWNKGKYVPELAELIYDMNKNPSLFIDLKGFLLGNPETSDSHDWQGLVDYAWSHAIVSDATHDITRDNCKFDSDDPWNNTKCRDAVERSLNNMIPRIMGSYDPCLDGYTTSFYNRPDVQKALHASDGHNIRNWSICNKQIFNEWKDSMPSVLPIYKKLIAGGLRIWVYSGDTDGRVPVLSTRYCLDTLGLPTVGPWRPWYHKKQVLQ
ncbi:putative serine carboxypeptidase-like 30 [Phoenix dactylifera]|uniref:Serine carboxypeptidase-like 30 n=1 Tax=Phoenix dactylifera TaxID=42345 RepID=A0A8B8ZZZ9_PHODC|nr:putative serine carboxypeptidase-like 30 [Phoenix dactylifera]